MMQIRCQRCGWNFTLGRETIGLAVAEAQAAHLEYCQFVCPKSRHEVKVQVDVLLRHLPLDYVLPTPLPKPEPVTVLKSVEDKPSADDAHLFEAVSAPRPAAIELAAKPIGSAKSSGAAKPVKAAAPKKSASQKPAATKVAAKKSTVAAVKKSAVKKSKQ